MDPNAEADAAWMEDRKRAVEIGLLDGPLTPGRYGLLRDHLTANGYRDEYHWAMDLACPENPEVFAVEAVWVILNSGMKNQVAEGIGRRIWPLLKAGKPVSGSGVFGHTGKCAAIDMIWSSRMKLFADFKALKDTEAQLAFCEALPWVGPITKYHLAKNWGVDVAKPDRHLERLAALHRTTTAELCRCLAAVEGEPVRVVDTVLWRACNLGLIKVVEGGLQADLAMLPRWETVPAVPPWLEAEFRSYAGEVPGCLPEGGDTNL